MQSNLSLVKWSPFLLKIGHSPCALGPTSPLKKLLHQVRYGLSRGSRWSWLHASASWALIYLAIPYPPKSSTGAGFQQLLFLWSTISTFRNNPSYLRRGIPTRCSSESNPGRYQSTILPLTSTTVRGSENFPKEGFGNLFLFLSCPPFTHFWWYISTSQGIVTFKCIQLFVSHGVHFTHGGWEKHGRPISSNVSYSAHVSFFHWSFLIWIRNPEPPFSTFPSFRATIHYIKLQSPRITYNDFGDDSSSSSSSLNSLSVLEKGYHHHPRRELDQLTHWFAFRLFLANYSKYIYITHHFLLNPVACLVVYLRLPSAWSGGCWRKKWTMTNASKQRQTCVQQSVKLFIINICKILYKTAMK